MRAPLCTGLVCLLLCAPLTADEACTDLDVRLLCRQLSEEPNWDRAKGETWLIALGAEEAIEIALEDLDQKAFLSRNWRNRRRPSSRTAAALVARIRRQSSWSLEQALVQHAPAAGAHREFLLDSARGNTELGRGGAMKVLARWGPDEDTLPLFVAALRDSERHVREVAFQAIAPGLWRVPFQFRSYFHGNLKVHPDDRPPWLAIWTEPRLRRYRDAVVDALVASIRDATTDPANTDSWAMQYDQPRAARWLGRVPPNASTLDALCRASEGPSHYGSYRAIETLLKLSKTHAIPAAPFLAAVARGRPEAILAMQALKAPRYAQIDPIPALQECVRTTTAWDVPGEAMNMLVALGSENREWIGKLFKNRWTSSGFFSSTHAYEFVCSRLPAPAAVEILPRFSLRHDDSIQLLLPLLESRNLSFRFVVADALAQMDVPSAMQEVLRAHPLPWRVVHRPDLFRLYPQLIPRLIRELASPRQRSVALRTLTDLGAAARPAVPTLVQYAGSDGFGRGCIELLARLGVRSRSVSEALRNLVRSADKETRHEAALALATLAESVEDVTTAIDCSGELDLSKLVEALSGNAFARNEAIRIVSSEKDRLRDRRGIELLQRLGHAVPSDLLVRYLETGGDLAVLSRHDDLTHRFLPFVIRATFPVVKKNGAFSENLIKRMRLTARQRSRLARTLSHAHLRLRDRDTALRELIALPAPLVLETLRQAAKAHPSSEVFREAIAAVERVHAPATRR